MRPDLLTSSLAVGGFLVFFSLLAYANNRWREAERERLLGPLRRLFDLGAAEFRQAAFFSWGVNRRILGGRRGGRDFELWLEGPKKRRGRYGRYYDWLMGLRLSAPSPVAFKAGREDWMTRLGVGLGLLQDVRLGDAALDQVFRFRGPDAEAVAALGRRSLFLQALREAAADPLLIGLEADETGLTLYRRHDDAPPLVSPPEVTRAVAALESLRASLSA